MPGAAGSAPGIAWAMVTRPVSTYRPGAQLAVAIGFPLGCPGAADATLFLDAKADRAVRLVVTGAAGSHYFEG
jgi:hypothetical protein